MGEMNVTEAVMIENEECPLLTELIHTQWDIILECMVHRCIQDHKVQEDTTTRHIQDIMEVLMDTIHHQMRMLLTAHIPIHHATEVKTETKENPVLDTEEVIDDQIKKNQFNLIVTCFIIVTKNSNPSSIQKIN